MLFVDHSSVETKISDSEHIAFAGLAIPDNFVISGKRVCVVFTKCSFAGSVVVENAGKVVFNRPKTEVTIRDSNIGRLSVVNAADEKKVTALRTDVPELVVMSEPIEKVTPLLVFPEIERKETVTMAIITSAGAVPFSLPQFTFPNLRTVKISCDTLTEASPQLQDLEFEMTERCHQAGRCLYRSPNVTDAERRSIYSGVVTFEQIAEFHQNWNHRYSRNRSIYDSTQTVHITGLEECFKGESGRLIREFRESGQRFLHSAWMTSVDENLAKRVLLNSSDSPEITLNVKAAAFKVSTVVDPSSHKDWLTRLDAELTDGRGKCIPGRLGRVINSFGGFQDKDGNDIVTVKISEREELSNTCVMIRNRNIGKPAEEVTEILYAELISRGFSDEVAKTWSNPELF